MPRRWQPAWLLPNAAQRSRSGEALAASVEQARLCRIQWHELAELYRHINVEFLTINDRNSTLMDTHSACVAGETPSFS